ncbi:glycosyltransferase [Spongiivirga citrea]|uniref:Glycosyltransferase n=1 Tax=Spongiivirga citrea TaxID=1481457 RepID=A0A6M0CLU4_9FLAO|nr:glycosyltransferase [Spongiivirga citrea]NER18908.1 glycosyltransferase [Spongiivirga citrea]
MIAKKILIVQRVITPYRLELFAELCHRFKEVGIITSKGEATGALRLAPYKKYLEKHNNLRIYKLKSLKIPYTGESRSTSFFFYPQVIFKALKYDILLLEGVTNLINNFYLVPISRIFNKKIIWWDPGYSRLVRSKRRKLIDAILKPFVRLSHIQMSYSSTGEKYLKNYMGAKNCFTNLNTINTNYFKPIQNEINKNIDVYSFDKELINLLYVGVVEKRKKIEELIIHVNNLNKEFDSDRFFLNVIGGGNQLDFLKKKYSSKSIKFQGPIYDKSKLKNYYFKSDLFVLPGDGGLAILQSLLYGLPVLCIEGADGTELDYIDNKDYILSSTEEIFDRLKSISSVDKTPYKNYLNKVSSELWIENLVSQLK